MQSFCAYDKLIVSQLVNSPRFAVHFLQVPLETCGRKTGPVSSTFTLTPGLECSPTMSLQLGMLFLFWEFSLRLTLLHTHTFNRSEEKLYKCVMTYAAQFKDDQNKKDEVLTLLLPCLRFNFLSIDFLLYT